MTRQAVILAGGKGTRLAARLNGMPKPLVIVDGMPLLERQLRQLSAAGFTDVLVLVNHARDPIEEFCRRVAIPGLTVSVRDDGATPRGTAGAVYEARDGLAERFLVVYGDTLFDIDLERFWTAHETARRQGAEATLFLHPNDHPHDSDLIEIDPDGRIIAFHPKPHPPSAYFRNLVNAALYVIERRLVLAFPPGEGVVDYGHDLFPAIVAAGQRLNGYVSYEYIKDLGTPERLDRVVADVQTGKVARARISQSQKAVFLDRDGTLNRLAGHIATPDALELLPGVGEAVRNLNRAEYRCVLITNQPVIARGECTIEGLERIHAKLETKLGEEGAFLDAIYYCPHHPDPGFPGEVRALKKICSCRKPAPGMILQAASDLSIDPALSWFVGDGAPDIGAARAVGVRSVLLRNGGTVATNMVETPDYEVESLAAAAELILREAVLASTAVEPWLDQIMPGTLLKLSGQSREETSVIAAVFRERLGSRGMQAVHLRLDHWTKPVADASKGAEMTPCYDLAAIDAALASWTSGGGLDLVAPLYNPTTLQSCPNGPHFTLPADGVLIVDSISGLEIATGTRKQLSLSVTLDCVASQFLSEIRDAH